MARSFWNQFVRGQPVAGRWIILRQKCCKEVLHQGFLWNILSRIWEWPWLKPTVWAYSSQDSRWFTSSIRLFMPMVMAARERMPCYWHWKVCLLHISRQIKTPPPRHLHRCDEDSVLISDNISSDSVDEAKKPIKILKFCFNSRCLGCLSIIFKKTFWQSHTKY